MSRFQVFKDAGGKWRWRLRAGNGKTIATSGESFASHYNAVRAALNVKANAGTAAPPFDDYSMNLLGRALRQREKRQRGEVRGLAARH